MDNIKLLRNRKKAILQSPVTPVLFQNEGPYRCHNNSCSSPFNSWVKNSIIEGQYLRAKSVNIFTFQTKMKFKRSRSKSLGKSEDEGFDSPSTPTTSPVTPQNSLTDEISKLAPLANGEDLNEEEKHEKEATKEEPVPEITVRLPFIFHHKQAEVICSLIRLL